MIKRIRLLVAISISKLLEKLHIVQRLNAAYIKGNLCLTHDGNLSAINLAPRGKAFGGIFSKQNRGSSNKIRNIKEPCIPSCDNVRRVIRLGPMINKVVKHLGL